MTHVLGILGIKLQPF